jgi:hypothetical protein
MYRETTTTTTNRKGFIKRAGLAIAGVFAVSSATRLISQGQASSGTTASLGKQSVGKASAKNADASRQASAMQDVPASAMARVRTAKGAVSRQA